MTIRNLAHRASRAIQGVTLVELLVVLLIISLLATAAVPVFLNRIEDARRAVTRQEVEEIAKAQQLCALYHGVFVPLQVLDDLPNDPSVTTDADDILNSAGGNYDLILITVRARDQQGSQPGLNTTDAVGSRVIETWQGPFLNPQRVWTNNKPNDITQLTDAEQRNDHPLDPYGNPYRFFSPIGIIGTGALNTTSSSYNNDSFSDGALIQTAGNPFDRYAIVSFGPDGLSPTDTNDSDDNVVYLFGTDGVESSFRF